MFAKIHAVLGSGNSFGLVHDFFIVIHANSCGANACGNSRLERGHDDRGGTKPVEYEYSVHGQASCCRIACFFTLGARSVHDEAWASRVQSSSLRIPQGIEIVTGCVVTVSYLPSSSLLGRAGKHDKGKLKGQGCGFSGVP